MASHDIGLVICSRLPGRRGCGRRGLASSCPRFGLVLSTKGRAILPDRTGAQRLFGLAIHIGGSVPYTDHWRKLTQELDREPTAAELYLRTHKRPLTQEWISNHSRSVHDSYVSAHEEAQSQPSTAASSSGIGTESGPSDYEIWKRVAGKKKWRVYGLRAKSIALVAQHSRMSLGLKPP